MSYIFVGLGNPDQASLAERDDARLKKTHPDMRNQDYSLTRHNAGRLAVDFLREHFDFPEWKFDTKRNALITKGALGKKGTVEIIAPQTFMNKSGDSLKTITWNAKKAEKLVVFHDDLDLPLGRIKISFNKSPGGHRGVLSIVKTVKTEAFIRVRIGISPVGAKGAIKKPQGEEAVEKFILGQFKSTEQTELKKEYKKIAEAMEILVVEGIGKAMTVGNRVEA